MPGKASLAASQYYAHRHNLFWPFMQKLFVIDPRATYEERLDLLQSHGVALWDVLKECFRSSSLDGDIVETSIIANDFATFITQHSHIRRIFFNGEKAEKAFKRYVKPGLTGMEHMLLVRLPSTSPANASIPMAQKELSWKRILEND